MSAAGGFALEVPADWRTEARQPAATSSTFVEGREPGVFGRLARAGFWVGRWPRGDRSVAGLEADLASTAAARDRGEIREVAIGGRPAVRWTHDEARLGALSGFVPGATVAFDEYRIVSGPFVYQLGFWTTAVARFAPTFQSIVVTFTTSDPAPQTIRRRDLPFTVQVPATWIERTPTLPGAVLSVAATDAWLHVFSDENVAPADARDRAVANLLAGGATDLRASADGGVGSEVGDAVDGGSTLRLDFRYPDPPRTDLAYDTEWFVADRTGGTLVLAIGRFDPTSTVQDEIARTFSPR